ncbi:hypothetical protein [Methanobrevibacter sp.]
MAKNDLIINLYDNDDEDNLELVDFKEKTAHLIYLGRKNRKQKRRI